MLTAKEARKLTETSELLKILKNIEDQAKDNNYGYYYPYEMKYLTRFKLKELGYKVVGDKNNGGYYISWSYIN